MSIRKKQISFCEKAIVKLAVLVGDLLVPESYALNFPDAYDRRDSFIISTVSSTYHLKYFS